MQWYAFHKEPPGGTDAENGRFSKVFHAEMICLILLVPTVFFFHIVEYIILKHRSLLA